MKSSSRIIGILQARTNSRRLPAKVLKPILGVPMILRQIERLRRSSELAGLIVATTNDPSDDELVKILSAERIEVFRGDDTDVLDRMYHAAQAARATDVVRLTADCPLTDPEIIDQLVHFYRSGRFDYASNVIEPSYPDGLDAEIVSFSALHRCWHEADSLADREHVTVYIRAHPELFSIGSLKRARDLSALRWTVDEQADYDLVQTIYEALYPRDPSFNTEAIVDFLETHPDVTRMSAGILRNEGLKRTQYFERYQKSTEYLEKAEGVIPLGSQTFSKSKTQFPVGVSPLCIERGRGATVWDIDGNEFLDLGGSLGAINLGYCDETVDAIVRAQLEKGTIFPLPSSIEMAVAQQLVAMIPCAEMVRFGKNGSDATTGAIRLARAYTERDEILTIGYHGWHDWYIGSTTKDRGIPKRTSEMTHRLPYNDLEAIARLFDERGARIAALIMEPMNREYPNEGYLHGVQALCRHYGAVLIFDEMITGFRYAKGGAQELFGVTPDLATFGKGIANGYPLSALVGRREIMRLLEDIFFSFTFGGDTLSLAAASAVLKKVSEEPVIETIHEVGTALLCGVRELITAHNLNNVVSVVGHPAWSILEFKDHDAASQWELKTLFLQEIFYRGILTIGSHFPTYTLSHADARRVLSSYDDVFGLIRRALEEGNVRRQLVVRPLQPLFKVR